MTFVEFLDAQRPRLLLEYKLSQWFPGRFTPGPRNPHALLDESDLEDLKDRLIALMPRDSLIVTLWDWDVRFEQDLDDDRFFQAALGSDDTAGECAEQLASYFLVKADEFGIELGLDPGSEVEEADMVYDEAMSFVEGWRKAILN